MTQTIHPLDTEVLDVFDTKGAMIRVFSRDGIIYSDERLVLDRFEEHRHNGVTKLVRRYFADAGLGVIDLEHERAKRSAKAIAFPAHRNESA